MIVLLILIGLITGFLGGLLGIGGGVISVPAIYYFLFYFTPNEGSTMHLAIATALASTFLTSLGSTFSHLRKKGISSPALKWIFPGLFVGCLLGALFAHSLSSDLLKKIFGAVAIFLGTFFFFPRSSHPHFGHRPNASLILWGLAIGCLSTLLGIGGGIFMIPVLLGYHLSLQHTIATSSAGTLITAFLGSALYLAIGWNQVNLPATFGYIYLPGFLAVGLGSLLTTHWGAHLAHTLPTPLIKRIFACVLAATGIAMVLGR